MSTFGAENCKQKYYNYGKDNSNNVWRETLHRRFFYESYNS